MAVPIWRNFIWNVFFSHEKKSYVKNLLVIFCYKKKEERWRKKNDSDEEVEEEVTSLLAREIKDKQRIRYTLTHTHTHRLADIRSNSTRTQPREEDGPPCLPSIICILKYDWIFKKKIGKESKTGEEIAGKRRTRHKFHTIFNVI